MEEKYFARMVLGHFASIHMPIVLFPFDFCRDLLNLSSLGIRKEICSLLTVGLSLRPRGCADEHRSRGPRQAEDMLSKYSKIHIKVTLH